MKRSFSQPSTSGESDNRSRLFSLQQALDLVYDSDKDEQDLADIYPESDLELVDSDVNSESSNEDEGLDVDLDLDLSSLAPRPSTAQVGHGTGRNRSRPTAGGDADNLSTGWTRAFGPLCNVFVLISVMYVVYFCYEWPLYVRGWKF